MIASTNYSLCYDINYSYQKEIILFQVQRLRVRVVLVVMALSKIAKLQSHYETQFSDIHIIVV